MNFRNKPITRLVFLLFCCLCISGCDNSKTTQSQLHQYQVQKASAGWPRTITTENGTLTLNHAPKRIVSTSVTLTGTLLAINAPVVGSGATLPNTSVASEQGFLKQWAKIAKQRGVLPLYHTEANAEAIIKARPDLIIIAKTGGDSALKLYDQLQGVAPILVIGYDDKSWKQLARIFADLLGLEQQADTIINDFEHQVAATKHRITLPPQPTTAMVYYQDGSGANIWTKKSAQGKLLQELGFQIASVPDAVKGNLSMGKRDDITIVTGEQFADAVTGNSTLLFAANKQREQDFINNSYLQDVATVKNNQVYAVGNDTFRLDFYSASNLLTRLQHLFAAN